MSCLLLPESNQEVALHNVKFTSCFQISTSTCGKKVGICCYAIFRCVHASLYEGLSVRRSIRPSVVRGPWSVPRFFLTRKLIRNSIESLEKSTHCSLTAITCKKLLKHNFKTKFENKILKQNFETKF